MLSVTFTNHPGGTRIPADYTVGPFDAVCYEHNWRSPHGSIRNALVGRRHSLDEIIGLQNKDFFWEPGDESPLVEYYGFVIEES
jgi:hypothetical protein